MDRDRIVLKYLFFKEREKMKLVIGSGEQLYYQGNRKGKGIEIIKIVNFYFPLTYN